ncbi:hypothetical protein I3679_013390 [Proteus mirabilis]|uniref:Uncharacterized protein n=1 Tax=Proteus mirabilis TaxID=584 RepID=A0ABD5LXK9_PROMI
MESINTYLNTLTLLPNEQPLSKRALTILNKYLHVDGIAFTSTQNVRVGCG